MSWCRYVWALVAAAMILGCGTRDTRTRVTPPPPMEGAKIVLKDIAETGQVGSGIDEVVTALEELKKTDAAKAEPLLKAVAELQSKSGMPEQAKAKAKEILDKL